MEYSKCSTNVHPNHLTTSVPSYSENIQSNDSIASQPKMYDDKQAYQYHHGPVSSLNQLLQNNQHVPYTNSNIRPPLSNYHSSYRNVDSWNVQGHHPDNTRMYYPHYSESYPQNVNEMNMYKMNKKCADPSEGMEFNSDFNNKPEIGKEEVDIKSETKVCTTNSDKNSPKTKSSESSDSISKVETSTNSSFPVNAQCPTSSEKVEYPNNGVSYSYDKHMQSQFKPNPQMPYDNNNGNFAAHHMMMHPANNYYSQMRYPLAQQQAPPQSGQAYMTQANSGMCRTPVPMSYPGGAGGYLQASSPGPGYGMYGPRSAHSPYPPSQQQQDAFINGTVVGQKEMKDKRDESAASAAASVGIVNTSTESPGVSGKSTNIRASAAAKSKNNSKSESHPATPLSNNVASPSQTSMSSMVDENEDSVSSVGAGPGDSLQGVSGQQQQQAQMQTHVPPSQPLPPGPGMGMSPQMAGQYGHPGMMYGQQQQQQGPPPGPPYHMMPGGPGGAPVFHPGHHMMPMHHHRPPYGTGGLAPPQMVPGYHHPHQQQPHQQHSSQPHQQHAQQPSPGGPGIAAASAGGSEHSSVYHKLMELGNEPDRPAWLERYLRFMHDNGTPLTAVPSVVKQPLDLYRLFHAVRERGGLLSVVKTKRWKEICLIVNVNASASGAYTLRRNYIKCLLDYECKFERNGADPAPILQEIQNLSDKKKKSSSRNSGSSPSTLSSGQCSNSDYPGSGASTPRPASMSGHEFNSHPPPGFAGGQPYGALHNGGAAAAAMMHRSPMHGYPPRPGYPPGGQYPQPGPSGPPRMPGMMPVGAPGYPTGVSGGGSSVSPVPPAGMPPHHPVTAGAAGPGQMRFEPGMLPPGPGWGKPVQTPPQQQQPGQPPQQQQPGQPPQWSSPGISSPGLMPSSSSNPHPMQMPMSPGSSGGQQGPGSQSMPIYTGELSSRRMEWKSTYGGMPPPPAPPPSSGSARPQMPQQQQQMPMMLGQQQQQQAMQQQYHSGMPPHSGGCYGTPGANGSQQRLGPPSVTGSRPTASTYSEPNYKSLPTAAAAAAVASGNTVSHSGCGPVGANGVPVYPVRSHLDNAKPGQANYPITFPKSNSNFAKRIENLFPADSVEATQPDFSRKRKYCSKDIKAFNSSAVTMALRSGLVCETSSALACLSVWSRDDAVADKLCLKNGGLLPLLQALIELWRRSLAAIFGSLIFCDDLELPAELAPVPLNHNHHRSLPPLDNLGSTDIQSRLLDNVLSGDKYADDGRPHPHPPVRLDPLARLDAAFQDDRQTCQLLLSLCGDEDEHGGYDDAAGGDGEPVMARVAGSVRDLWSRGGSDTTDHIMPPVLAQTECHQPAKRHRLDSRPSLAPSSPGPPCLEQQQTSSAAIDPVPSLQARSEIVSDGESLLFEVTEADEEKMLRCLSVSTVLRNFSFLPGNDRVMAVSPGLLVLLSRLLLLGHDHEDDSADHDDGHEDEHENSSRWWQRWMEEVREHVLVTLVNVASYVDLTGLPDAVVRPLVQGVLHWLVCPSSAAAEDPLPSHRVLGCRRLALEALMRLLVHDSNVDFVLHCPQQPSTSTHCPAEPGRLFDFLAACFCHPPELQVVKEMALACMHYLSLGGLGSGSLQLAAARPSIVGGLLGFIELTEAQIRHVVDNMGMEALQARPELMGTSLELLRQSGALLHRLAAQPRNRCHFSRQHEMRMLNLVISTVLDQTVAQSISGVLYLLSATDCAASGGAGTTSSNSTPLLAPVPPSPPLPLPLPAATVSATSGIDEAVKSFLTFNDLSFCEGDDNEESSTAVAEPSTTPVPATEGSDN